jgi:hypothetical protein
MLLGTLWYVIYLHNYVIFMKYMKFEELVKMLLHKRFHSIIDIYIHSVVDAQNQIERIGCIELFSYFFAKNSQMYT